MIDKLTEAEIAVGLVLAGLVAYGIYKAHQAAVGAVSDSMTAVSNAAARSVEGVKGVYNSAVRSTADTFYDYFGPSYQEPTAPGYPAATGPGGGGSSQGGGADDTGYVYYGSEGVGLAKRGATPSQAMTVFNMMGTTRQPLGDLDNGADFNSYPDNFQEASMRMAKPSMGRLSQPSSTYAG